MSYGRAKEGRPHRFAYDFGPADPGMHAPAPDRNRPRRAPRRSVAYTIPLGDEGGGGGGGGGQAQQCADAGHVLGVNALALALPGGGPGAAEAAQEAGGVLFSGGRDGVIKVWDLGFPLRRRRGGGGGGDDDDGGGGWAIDRARARQQRPRTQLRASRAVHQDWINDVVVINGGQTVVSASSDQTVRAWTPAREDERPQTVGSHMDYVKALAYSEHRQAVISGGLDRQIKLWDVGQARASSGPICALGAFGSAAPSSSVYALACNAQGSLVVSGSPEKIVRVWDPRAGRQLTTLTGHTDHIRAVLLSADSELVLSGSSDTTVKLWSMRMRRCLSTYTQHSDSVWALHAAHPRLQTFYSASRDGLVAKTVGAGLAADDGAGGPPYRRASLTPRGPGDDAHAGPGVVCVAVAREPQGVVRLVAADGACIWTATKGTGINRWLDVSVAAPGPAAQPTERAAGLDAPSEVPRGSLMDALQLLQLEPSASASASGAAPDRPGQHQHQHSPGDDRGPARPLSAAGGVASPVFLAMQAELGRRATAPTTTAAEAPGTACGPPAPISIPGALSPGRPARHNSSQPHQHQHPQHHPAPGDAPLLPESPLPSASLIEAVSAARSPLPRPQQARDARPLSSPGRRDRVLVAAPPSDVVPVRAAPDETIRGRHGLRRHRLLPSKRHVLAQDTRGRVSLWDIMLCRRVHEFPESADGAAAAAGTPFPGVFGTDFDAISRAVATEPEAVSSWCHVDTRTGALTVHLSEPLVWSAEVHVDEVDGVPHEAVQAMGDHERVNIGQWMLKRLFLSYARARVRQGPIAPQEAALLNRWAAQIPVGEVVSAARPPGQRQTQPPGTPQIPQVAEAAPLLSRAATTIAAAPLPQPDPGSSQERREEQSPAPSVASVLESTAAQIGLGARVVPPPSPPPPPPPPPRSAAAGGASPTQPPAGTAGASEHGRGDSESKSDGADGQRAPEAPHPRPDGSPRHHHQHQPSIDAAPGAPPPPPPPPQHSQQQQQPSRGADGDGLGASAGKLINRLRSMRMRKQKSTSTTSTASAGSPSGTASMLSPSDADSGAAQSTASPSLPPIASRTASAPGAAPSTAAAAAAAASASPAIDKEEPRPLRDEFAEWAGPRYPTDTERTLALLRTTPAPWDQLYSPVVCPRLPLPRGIIVRVLQECFEASEPFCIYRSTADGIPGQPPADGFLSALCVSDDPLLSFELCMPTWLADFLLFNRLPAGYQEPPKVSFVLSPAPAATLPPFPNQNARLVANRMLRARKLAIYVVEKLCLPLMAQPPPSYISAVEACMSAYSSRASDEQQQDAQQDTQQTTTSNAYADAFVRAGEVLSDAERIALDDVARWRKAQGTAGGREPSAEYTGRPELYLALLCKERLVPPGHTLATIKASIWKASSDVQIHYQWADFVGLRMAKAQSLARNGQE
ncbi:hypothetical protein H4R18_000307 [Coemansia javaensis]|uniref:WD40 repeat-like protein n=1 Tax=Coemansia javaensis TaxID=2761396 RepID=A0A9W8LLW6_9FUNG|nr:hypothetical protein H4R18_000307 [Coemansia javaensis]